MSIICMLLIDWCYIFFVDEFCSTTPLESMIAKERRKAAAEKAAKEAAELRKGLRLNKTIIPYHYDLELWPRFYEGDDFSFTGEVTIHFTAKKESDVIVLHVDMLTVHEDSLRLRCVLYKISDMTELSLFFINISSFFASDLLMVSRKKLVFPSIKHITYL